ncbi:MAG: glutathione peroxidase [Lentisphaerae bacterium GWF2_44_16]|nr:MAG: glutathione peroxidase [Lentisphaerae bacterium GWF2_44_16]
MDTLYTISVKTIDGKECDLSKYAEKVMLIVNTASKCGFTGQYKGLEELYKKYKDRDLIVLGFPCNQFNSQEPGTEAEISSFCELNYGVTFPLFSKIDVNGDNAHPLYKELKQRAPGILGTQIIKWNFTKFLVGRGAETVKRFASAASPEALEKEIETLL